MLRVSTREPVSDCALEALALDAGGANVHTLGFPVDPRTHALDVRVEAAVGAHVGVRNRLAELRALSANVAN